MAEKYELAEKDYVLGMKYKEIADKYCVTINTVKSWKQRYSWTRDGNKKSVHTKTKKVCTQNKSAKVDADELADNDNLTDDQKLFCAFYIKSFNATKAYQKAYGVENNVAAAAGCRLLKNQNIIKQIKSLKQNRLNIELLSQEDILQKYMDIAFADIGDYVSWGQETVPVMGPFGPIKVKNPDTGEEETVMQVINSVRFKESGVLDSSIILEVKNGRSGAIIKLNDRMKALEFLTKYFDMNPTDVRKAEYDKRKLELEMLKIEMQTKEDSDEEQADDNFLEALNESAKEVWSDE